MDAQLQQIFLEIKEAEPVVREFLIETPVIQVTSLSKFCNCNLFLKLENHQRTGSFKARGACNAVAKLLNNSETAETVKKNGVIAVSSGNHAQAVAFAAKKFGVQSFIVMPQTAPFAKVKATKEYGAGVLLHGAIFDEAVEECRKLTKEKGMTFIHPFNDPHVIAGQGTIGLEIIRQVPSADIVLIPVGGGGLSTGAAIAIKSINPNVKVYGVEAEGANAMYLSLQAGEITSAPKIDTICDGIAIKTPGSLTYELAKKVLDGVIVVSDAEVAKALFLIMERSKNIAEPSACTTVAALLANKVPGVKGKNVVALLSGGNVNMGLMSRIVTQQLVAQEYRSVIKGIVADNLGALNKITGVLGGFKALNLVSINHDRTNPLIQPNKAEVSIELEVPSHQDLLDLLEKLHEQGFDFCLSHPRTCTHTVEPHLTQKIM